MIGRSISVTLVPVRYSGGTQYPFGFFQIVQESLADAKVSARQQCVYEDPSEEIYSKFAIDG